MKGYHWISWTLFVLLSPIYIPLLFILWAGDGAELILYEFVRLENRLIGNSKKTRRTEKITKVIK